MIRVAIVACALAVLGAAVPRFGVGFAQQPSPPFRAATNLVEVDVVVRDANGRLITDLKPEDFQVGDEGRPQRVELFYLAAAGASDAPSTSPSAALADTAGRSASSHRLFVVVFDDEHLSPGGFRRVQAAAETLFTSAFRQGDLGGVVAHGEIANKRLTSDREELLQAVRRAKPNSRSNSRAVDFREWPSLNEAEALEIVRVGPTNDPVFEEVVRRACVDDPSTCAKGDDYVRSVVIEKSQRMMTEVRVASDRVLHALASLISGLERFDGRKTLLLLTDGFVADQSWPLVEQAVGLAARANARIYTLDARGLDRFPQPASNYAPHDDGLGHLLGSLDVAADAMNSLAVDTGGFAVRNVNMFDKAIAQITDEASTYYVLGYRPDTLPDGKFHHITVRVKRPGVAVRARRGYVATIRPDPRLTAATEVPAARPLESSSLTAPVSVLPSAVDPRSLAPAAQPDASATGAANPAMPTAAEGSGSRIRLRPDAVKHVESLASATRADAAAASGWEAYERGDLESARAALSVAAAQPASPAWVHYALGQAEYALGDWAGAVREWDHVRDAAPGFEPVYFDLVDGFLQQKEYDRAVRLLRSAAARWPHDPDVFDALGVVQVTRGALDDAVGSFQRAIAAAPEQSVAYFNLAKTYELRYIKSRRYVQATRSWAANEADRRNATAAYNKYLELGGPLASSAREGLARLEWQVSR